MMNHRERNKGLCRVSGRATLTCGGIRRGTGEGVVLKMSFEG